MEDNNTDSPSDFLSRLHPAHLAYLKEQPVNTAEYFISALDSLDPGERNAITGTAIYLVNGAPNGFQNNDDDYAAFKKHLLQLRDHPIVAVVIVGIVHLILAELLRLGNVTDVDIAKNRLVDLAETLISRNPEEIRSDSMKWLVDHIERLPERAVMVREHYVHFCESVIEKLLNQPLG